MGIRVLFMKLVAASAAVISSSVALRLATPAVTEFLSAEAPRIYQSVSAWLTPPYIYFVINGIIISIAATSRFQKPIPASDHQPFDPTLSAVPPAVSSYTNPAATEYVSEVADGDSLRSEFISPAISADELMVTAVETDKEEGFVISRSSWSPRRRGSSEDLQEMSPSAGVGGATTEKPPVSIRVGRRRSTKASPEAGKPLGVARPRKHDTLESTWRTITDGRPVPLARHLKKADTLEGHMRATTADPAPPPPTMLKSETFGAPSVATDVQLSPLSCSGESPPPSGKLRRDPSVGKLRREPSLGQDDLNRRVEAFIKKFNEEMRLQRQNSLQQYMHMINCSSH